MKNKIWIILIFAVALLLCACGGSKYGKIVKEISSSDGAYDVWNQYKDDEKAASYILKNISPDDVSKLITESNSLYGYSMSHTSDMADILKIMEQNGFENFQKDVVLRALNIYLPTTPGYDEQSLSSLSDLEGSAFYSAVNEIFGGASEKEDAENLLLTEAFKRAESKLKNQLKNPRSYKRDSIMGSEVQYDPETGEYTAIIVIKYTATNSFGAEVQDTFTYSESGTYINGKIKYSEN